MWMDDQGERFRTFSSRFALNTFCMTLKFAINSYSCFAFILTRAIGTSTENTQIRQQQTQDEGFRVGWMDTR